MRTVRWSGRRGGVCMGRGCLSRGCLPRVGVSAWGEGCVSQHALGQTPSPCEQNDRCLWKYFLAATMLYMVKLHVCAFYRLQMKLRKDTHPAQTHHPGRHTPSRNTPPSGRYPPGQTPQRQPLLECILVKNVLSIKISKFNISYYDWQKHDYKISCQTCGHVTEWINLNELILIVLGRLSWNLKF